VLLDLGLHVVNAGYQRAVGCYLVLQASAGLYAPWLVNNNVLGLAGGDHDPPGDVLGGVVRLRAFITPLGDAPGGLWLSPFAQVGAVRGSRAGGARPGVAFAAGLSVGWAWVIARRVLLAVGVGAQLHLAAFDGTFAFPGFLRAAPTLDLNVGYAF
jgi:hypothetical protein